MSLLLTDDLVWELWCTAASSEEVLGFGDSPKRSGQSDLVCILRTRSKAEALRQLERLMDEWH